MLVLRPYSLPINPSKKRITEVLGTRGFLLGSKPWKGDDGREISLKRWVEEGPQFQTLKRGGEFAILRVFIQYMITDPESDFNERSGKTTVKWEAHRRSRVVTLWIPLSTNTSTDLLLSVGDIDEGDVTTLIMRLIPEASPDKIQGRVFDLGKVREENPHGWMLGCENRPNVIQRGTLYGDFTFSQHTELDQFLDSPNGTQSNQEGITIAGGRKVRVLKFGKFQLMGIQKEHFFDDTKRADVMRECFEVARSLL